MFKQSKRLQKQGSAGMLVPYFSSLLLLFEHDIVAALCLRMLWILMCVGQV